MALKQELQELALANGMKYFGIASVERLANLPAGHRPNDLLPGAKSVLVMGMVIPRGAIEGNKLAYGELRHAIFTYVVYGYNKINDQLDAAALLAIFHIEKKHPYKAYGIPASKPRDEKRFMSAMSNRYAAVCAGQGEFGWSGFVLTPEDGPRVRWISVITDAAMDPDPLYRGPKLCDPSQCRICVEACPTGALSGDQGVEVQIQDVRTAYSLRNKPLCRCATDGLVKGTPGRLQADIPAGMKTMDDWFALARKDSPWQRMEITHGNYCHRCMVLCPAGNEKLKPKSSLSSLGRGKR
jgi:epoxyqueuosine reductase